MHLPIPDPLPPQMLFTQWLIREVQEIVPVALNEIDGTQLEPKDVIVLPQLVHPWTPPNLSEVWLDIQPDDKAATYAQRQARIARIRTNILDILLDSMKHAWNGPRPSLDCEVHPIMCSGYTVDNLGTITASWGDVL
jgi:hypothetical protein